MARISGKGVRAALAVALTVGTISSVPPSAVAGSVAGNGGATEVTQILNNAELAMQTIQDEIRNLTMMKQLVIDQIQQLPLDIGGYADTFKEAMETYDTINSVIGRVGNLYGSVSGLKDAAMWRMNQFSASGLDWKSYVNREMDRARWEGKQTTMLSEYEQSAIQRVEADNKALQELQKDIKQDGVNASLGVVNAQMNTLGRIMNNGVEQSAVHYQAQTQRQIMEDARKNAYANESARARTDQNSARDASKTFADTLGRGKWSDPFAN